MPDRSTVGGQCILVVRCEAREHGDNEGCVCKLIGRVMVRGPQYETPFAGTPSYHLFGSTKRVRASEIEPLACYPSPPQSSIAPSDDELDKAPTPGIDP